MMLRTLQVMAVTIAASPAPYKMHMDPSRSTPQGYWTYSANYLISARAVDVKIQNTAGRVWLPSLQLYAIAIELALKAFLLKRGRTLQEIRNLGHRLDDGLSLARRHRLGMVVRLTKDEVSAIQLLSVTYATHRFRYMESGRIQLPHLIEIARAAESLVTSSEVFCTGRSDYLHRYL